MMDISAVVEGLTHDVLRFLISLFEGIFTLVSFYTCSRLTPGGSSVLGWI